MKTNRPRGRYLLYVVLLTGTLMDGAAYADNPLPPSVFTFDVTQGATVLPGCTGSHHVKQGGLCGSETSGPGFAATSGGIGTASYLPVTPGGTVLGTGTAVDATSSWFKGPGITSSASMTYSFQASGPSTVDFIPINVISTGLTRTVGNSTADLTLLIQDSGPDNNIPKGVPDPDPSGPLLDLTATCKDGACFGSWGTPGHSVSKGLCVVNGDNYTLTITAMTTAASGAGSLNDAMALLDPVIVLDPPSPKSCPVDVPLSELQIKTGPGASTGVPEPPGWSLIAAALLGLGFFAPRRCLGRQS